MCDGELTDAFIGTRGLAGRVKRAAGGTMHPISRDTVAILMLELEMPCYRVWRYPRPVS